MHRGSAECRLPVGPAVLTPSRFRSPRGKTASSGARSRSVRAAYSTATLRTGSCLKLGRCPRRSEPSTQILDSRSDRVSGLPFDESHCSKYAMQSGNLGLVARASVYFERGYRIAAPPTTRPYDVHRSYIPLATPGARWTGCAGYNDGFAPVDAYSFS